MMTFRITLSTYQNYPAFKNDKITWKNMTWRYFFLKFVRVIALQLIGPFFMLLIARFIRNQTSDITLLISLSIFFNFH